jgi:uncharacterized protein (DUF302 family)
MKKLTLVMLMTAALTAPVFAADGMVNVESSFTVADTADRLVGILNEKGMTVFNRINHSDGARNAGIDLNPTELIIFGNPKVGGPLMKCQQSVAIDLPQKALVWQDDAGKVWLSYNDPRYIEERHGVTGCEQVIAKIEQALAGISKAAAVK